MSIEAERISQLDRKIATLERELVEAREITLKEGKEWRGIVDKQGEALAAAQADSERVKNLVASQAEDGGLWFCAETAPEAYLQAALRVLHEAVEGKSQEKCARAAAQAAVQTETERCCEVIRRKRVPKGMDQTGVDDFRDWIIAAIREGEKDG